jgi:acyl-CoA thioesterase YciA
MNKNSRFLAIRTVMLPRDTNYMGHIFGGHILSMIDLAAAQHATFIANQKFVTKLFKEANFVAPVFVGDAVSFFTETVKIGNTSVMVRVTVEAQRHNNASKVEEVTTAEVLMVAVDTENKPTKIILNNPLP